MASSVYRQPAPTSAGPHGYPSLRAEVISLLDRHSPSSPQVSTALERLTAHYVLPPVQVVEPEVWGATFFRRNIHIKADYSAAAANIVRITGRRMSSDEGKTLRLLLTHPCGWSATYPSHVEDTWVRYVQALPKVPIEGLYPILDSLTWQEDIENYPPGCLPIDPSFFLFASSQKYYVYHFDNDDMFCAGDSLLDVYEGMKVGRFHGNKEGDWMELERHPAVEHMMADDFFPVYGIARNAITLVQPIKNFDEEYTKVMEGEVRT
jgi:hypothetical protein